MIMYHKGGYYLCFTYYVTSPNVKVQRCESALNYDRLSSCLKHIYGSVQANLPFFKFKNGRINV